MRIAAVAVRRGVLSLLAAVLCAAPALGQKALTVERIWGQPSLSGQLTQGLQWSSDGKLLSYLQRSGEGREMKTDVWAMNPESGERRLLVDSEKLAKLMPPITDAQTTGSGMGRATLSRYFWAPDSSALMFIAGGDLYWFDLKTQSGKQLTKSGAKHAVEDPKISPDGRWMGFVRNYDLWAVNIANGKETRLTTGGTEEVMNGHVDWVYPEELGLFTAWWWSPDSRQVAYLQFDQRGVTKYPLVNLLSYTGEQETVRYPKAGDANPAVRVGVVAARGGKTRWMDTGTDKEIYIPRVSWLPDSQRLAIQRLNRPQNTLELLLAVAATGRSQVVLREEDKFFVNVHNDLSWLKGGNEFLWSSERENFRHLYVHGADGKLLRTLTRGDWEVSSVSGVDEKNGAVYFVGTEKSALERHLYRVPLDGSAPPVRLTREDGTHGINLAPGAAHYVETYSNSVTPPRQDIYRADGTRAHALNENRVAELNEYRLQKPEYSTISDGRGGTLNTMMIQPPGFDASRKYPALMFTYGGPTSQVVQDSWGGANSLWHQMMAQKGYVIFLADNGGSAARGHASETPMYRDLGHVEVDEQVTAAKWLKAQPYIDGNRVGIWGWSYGGYMTCMLMLKMAGVWKAGFAGAPVTDWRQYDSIYTERYMGTPKDNAEGYARSAPSAYAAKLEGKLLIAHGANDDNVHYANTIKLQEEFIKAGKYAEIVMYPGRTHGISDLPARRHLFARVTQFFLDNL